jgi:hypothetical protein
MTITTRIVGGTIMLGLGALFGLIGIHLLRQGIKKVTQWRKTYGEVVDVEVRARSRGSSYYPKVEFRGPDRETIVFVASVGSNRRPSIGRKVNVRYSPDDPQKADIASLALWIFPFVMLLFTASFLTMSVVFYAGLSE